MTPLRCLELELASPERTSVQVVVQPRRQWNAPRISPLIEMSRAMYQVSSMNVSEEILAKSAAYDVVKIQGVKVKKLLQSQERVPIIRQPASTISMTIIKRQSNLVAPFEMFNRDGDHYRHHKQRLALPWPIKKNPNNRRRSITYSLEWTLEN